MEPSSVAPTASAAPTEEGLLSSVAVAMSTANPPLLCSGAFSVDAPSEKSMELDYANNPMVPTSIQPATTPKVIPSATEAAVVTNIATLATSEAGTSGSRDMANAVSECWADIVSNKEAEASKMDEQAG
ncbi:hypothetical protein C0989_000716, partial [Termitomyces sp. Mn162]